MLCENLPTFPNNNNYSIVEQDIIRNDKIGVGKKHHSNMDYSVYEGRELPGTVETVLLRGRVIGATASKERVDGS